MSLLKRGIYLGALAGAVLSIVYTAVAIPLVGILLVVTNIPGDRVFDALIGAGMFAMCAWPCAIPVGILPAVMIGALGGLLIGLLILPVQDRVSNEGAAIVGLLVGVGIVVAAHLWLFPGMIEETRPNGVLKYLPYLFWIGFPGVMILAGSMWVGWKIRETASRPEGGN
ncbi:MAG: hypothetical protein Kow0047_21140 [Anaerolineae bacterium]